MNYKQAVDYIKSIGQYGCILGLDNIRELLSRLGNPQDRLKVIHIGGTNGKGSTAAFISEILAQSGYKVGRYISPTILEYREKIQFTQRGSTKYISENAVSRYIEIISLTIEQMQQEGFSHPTPFEIETAMAFLAFVEEECDLVVLEVGLGGRLDATNIIESPVCVVLTAISMDHMQFLGDTVEKIAYEKAGIIKPGCMVISYDQEEEVRAVIETTCRKRGAAHHFVDFNGLSNVNHSLNGITFDYKAKNNQVFEGIKTNLLGENQPKNAALAIETAVVLESLGYCINRNAIYMGIKKTEWKGRFDILCRSPLFIADGGHNEAAAISLRKSIQLYFAEKDIIFILGILADKDYETILKNTADLAHCILTVTPENQRALDSEILAAYAEKYCDKVVNARTVENAVKTGMEMCKDKDVIIAFGSLSFMGDIYQILKNSCHPWS